MRIGEPAHRHGVSEPDAVHAMRRIVLDDDLTMLIGPADGRLLESASCTWTARTPSSYMRCQVKAHSTDEVSSGQAPIIHTMSGAG